METVEARVGDTVEVDVTLAANEVAGVEIHVLFDDAALEFVSAEVKGFVAGMEYAVANNPEVGEVRLTAMNSGEINSNGDEVVLTITFKVLDAAADVNALTLADTYVVHGDENQTAQKLNLTDGAVGVVRKGDGDLNGDGKVDLTDATLLFYYVNGLADLTEDQQTHGDINGDGKIDLTDATMEFYYVNGLTDTLG